MFDRVDRIADVGCCGVFPVQYLPLLSASAGRCGNYTFLAVSGISLLERIQRINMCTILVQSETLPAEKRSHKDSQAAVDKLMEYDRKLAEPFT